MTRLALAGREPPRPPEQESSWLLVVHGRDRGAFLPLENPRTTLGRTTLEGLVIEDDLVMNEHAVIERHGASWIIRDLDSTHGTFIEETRIESAILPAGKLLRLGRTLLRLVVGPMEARRYHDELYRISTLDGLTGVHTAVSFERQLAYELERDQRFRHPSTLVLLEITASDPPPAGSAGLIASDAVLRLVAELIVKSSEKSDIVARTEERRFAILRPGVRLDRGLAEATRLVASIASRTFEFDGKRYTVGASAGVAERDDEHASGEALVGKARERLAEAVALGENRVAPTRGEASTAPA